MAPGTRGVHIISWSQTEADGLRMPAPDLLRVGAGWRWMGQAVRVDHPGSLLLLEGAEGADDLHRRAARMVRRLVGAAVAPDGALPPEADDLAPEQGFVLTDGRQTWAATIVPVPDSAARLVMFVGPMPPSGRDLWIVRSNVSARLLGGDLQPEGGVICFAPGTLIATPQGPRPIEALRPGDRIDTADDGPQEILWSGQRRMSGARLYAMPHLRPVRIRALGLGEGRPQGDLLVSPQHRMLIRGPAADALFGTSEVLVRAQDLVNDHSVLVDTALLEVTYVHILLERHQIVFANGVPSESFHPQSAALDTLDPAQRQGLMELLPDPAAYGGYARRNLSASEAAILRHEAI